MAYVTVSLLPQNEFAPEGGRVRLASEPVFFEGRVVALSVSHECCEAFVVESFRLLGEELLKREVIAKDLGCVVLLRRPRPYLLLGGVVEATLRALRPARARISVGVHVQFRRRRREDEEGDEEDEEEGEEEHGEGSAVSLNTREGWPSNRGGGMP